MTAAAGRLPAATLEAVASALERGALQLPLGRLQLQRLVGDGDAGDVEAVVSALAQCSMEAAQAAVTLRLLAESKRAAEGTPRPQLVWSDLDVRGSRDTAVVAQELFREARQYVLLSTYNLGHRRREGEPPGHPVLRPLADRMSAVPGLRVRLFVNLRRMSWQADATEAEVLDAFGHWFRTELWPWPRVPEVYFDPRSLDGSGEDSACLHAKCIVVDDERAFVTSANLTEAAQLRNIEAGVLLHDVSFARALRLQFEALINREFVRRLAIADVHAAPGGTGG